MSRFAPTEHECIHGIHFVNRCPECYADAVSDARDRYGELFDLRDKIQEALDEVDAMITKEVRGWNAG